MKRFTQTFTAAALVIGMAGAAQAADIVFIVDESGSMYGEHNWLGNMVTSLESELIAAGETSNSYGLVGFGGTDSAGQLAHEHLVGGASMGSASDLSSATGGLVASGGFEDGYQAINFALSNYSFTSSAINFILVTDEDRDVSTTALSYSGMQAALAEAGVVLNAVVNANVKSDAGAAVGTNGTDAYVADGSGGYTTAAFIDYGTSGTTDYGNGDFSYVDTVVDYSYLAIATGGASWDLNQLRAGGVTAQSFTDAFVDIKVHEIITQTPEPGTLVLMTLGLVGIGARRLRK
jgi:hypothetical protein